MASSPPDLRHSATEATFAPFRLAWRTVKSVVLLWMVCVAVQIAWVRWHHIDVDTEMPELIGYYLTKAQDVEFVQAMALNAYWVAFEATAAQRTLTAKPNDSQSVGATTRRMVWAALHNDVRVAAYATVLFGVRIAITVLALPLFIALQVAAAVDGLAQRQIRKDCGGNESSALYHRAKLYGVGYLPPFAATIFLASPIAFDPALVLLPAAIGSAIALKIQAKYYKKYL
jgi:integrating conjugative element membrane protein (TIGR03747 family)